MATDDGRRTTDDEAIGNRVVRRPSSVVFWALFAILAAITVWSALSLLSGIEMRAFQQPIHNGDPSKLKTPLLAQTFLAPRDNLDRLEIRLASSPSSPLPPDISAILTQGGSPTPTPLYTARLDASNIISNSGIPYLSIPFPPIANSSGLTYTLSLQTPGYSINSVLQPAYSPIDALSSGAMYTEDGPKPGDLALTAYYRYNLLQLAADTWTALTTNLLTILAYLALLLLPGLAIILWLPNSLSPGQRLLAAPALSALSIPLIYLLASLVNLPIGRNKLLALLILCTIAIALKLIIDGKRRPTSALSLITYHLSCTSLVFWSALGLVTVITTATRLVSVRDIPAGEGMDAYHHTLVTALFLRDAGIPHTYAPFAPFSSFTYHFGFHSLSATIAWLTGNTQVTDLMSLIPQIGQIVSSVLPIPALVLFGWRILGNRWLGLTAAAFAGLLSVVPAFYGEWSRYTQGLGLAVLPVACLFFIEAVGWTTNDPSRRTYHVSRITISSILLAVLSAAGLFLTHYRIVIIYAAFAALYVAWRSYLTWKDTRTNQPSPLPISAYIAQIAPYLLRAALIGGLTLLVLLPWLLNLTQNFVKNFIDKSGQNIDAYFATAERLGAPVLGHPSLLILASLSALGLAILGLRTWRSPRAGLIVGLIAGLPLLGSALYLFLNPNPVALESNTRTALLGLSPVTWLLLLETVLLVILIIGSTQSLKSNLPAVDEPSANHRQPPTHVSRITYHVSLPSLILPALAWLILELWASPQLLPFRLPLVGYLDAVTLTSSAWLPACLLAAYAAVQTWAWLARRASATQHPSPITTPVLRTLLALSALLIALSSGLSLSPVNDRTPYIAPADMDAFAWMRSNLPPDSYVLTGSFSFPWSPDQKLGIDSGLWLPLATGLRSSVPPISAYNEKPSDPAYFAQVQTLASLRPDSATEATWQTLKAAGITHVYIGTRSAGDGFNVPALLADPHLHLLFHRDGVWLFQIATPSP